MKWRAQWQEFRWEGQDGIRNHSGPERPLTPTSDDLVSNQIWTAQGMESPKVFLDSENLEIATLKRIRNSNGGMYIVGGLGWVGVVEWLVRLIILIWIYMY